jgi:hypothetical protein
MTDIDRATSRSSLQFLGDEEEDGKDEIVFFGEDPEYETQDSSYDFYDYDELEGDFPPGYSRSELAQHVVFIKSSKDPNTRDFYRETKDLLWCLENGCEEASSGIWSGAWYFIFLYGEKEGNRAWIDAQNKRLVKESDGKARKFDNDVFCAMLTQKKKGNRDFSRGQYKSALDSYLEAEKSLGGAVSGFYLVPHQRAELVQILSNQAECYLRMQKYDDAILQATEALQLDKRHQKSLLRRAKASFYGAERLQVLNSVVAAQATEDLQLIIEMKSEGVEEAKSLMKDINAKVKAYAEQKL